ncbi:MAG: ParB/RepB/Spo0J family partition protein [Candidatus Dormibacteraeota bacterium]|nr:ParB/RepB/Spo0J family partition protein [Candidatus Dormibacteraeota bacterium]
MNKRRGLGRGLEALIPSGEYVDELGGDTAARRRFAMQIPIAEVRPNPEQPRRSFATEPLQELADSIRVHGVLQPLLVREGMEGFELIAGERRLRAAELAGLTEVPVIVHPTTGGRREERLELALVENLQRTDLNAIEEARAMQRLLREFGLTQEAVAERLGKSRVAVANIVRLLALPEQILKLVETAALSAGHARALLSLPSAGQQLAAAELVLKHRWSVRETEDWVRARVSGEPQTRPLTPPPDPDTAALEDEFRRALGTKVILTRLRKGGRLTIEFYSDEELEALRRRLS